MKSSEKIYNKTEGQWDMSGVPFAGEEERLSDAELDRASIRIVSELLKQDQINPEQEYDKLQQLLKYRTERLRTVKPAHLFLSYETMEKSNNGGESLNVMRFDPIRREVLRRPDWSYTKRAFVDNDGIFLAFPATPNGEAKKPIKEQRKSFVGYEKAYRIIDFAYTCEHELQHDLQEQRLEKEEISFAALRTARDYAVLGVLPYIEGNKGGPLFYWNAHNSFFIEEEANDAADAFLDDVISPEKTLSSTICNPNDLQQFQHTMIEVLESRKSDGRVRRGEEEVLIIEDEIKGFPKLAAKEYRGEAEEIIFDLCDDLVAAYPEYCFENYPVLLMEYNRDGSRRRLEDIEAEIRRLEQLGKGGALYVGTQKIGARALAMAYRQMIRHTEKFKKQN